MASDAPVASLSVMCTLAIRAAFEAVVIPVFERTGNPVLVHWAPTTLIMQRLAEGQIADVLLVTSEAMDALAADGVVDAATRVAVARSGLGVAAAANTRHPALPTVAAFTQALLAARSVAYSRAGASGIYFGGLLDRLGIADAVNARATIIPAGLTAERLLTGEADLAVQQLSELMVVPGIEIVGRFPGPVQTFITISAAVLQRATNPASAAAFIRTLRSDQAFDAYRASGLDPVADAM